MRRDGVLREGPAFDKASLLRLLKCPLYAGKVHHRGALHAGEHEAIVDERMWLEVQDLLGRNGVAGYQGPRANSVALLKGILHCAACGAAMTPSFTTKAGRRYRYYKCLSTIRKGAHACPTRAVPAHEIEQQVVERIREIGRDPALVAETVEQVRQQRDELIARLEAERRALAKDLRAKTAAFRRAKAQTNAEGAGSMLGDINAKIREVATRLEAIPGEIRAAKRITIDEGDVRAALEAFGPVWDSLLPKERARIIALLLEGVVYDGREKRIDIRFRAGGIGTA